ncbi:hypothetical protein FRC02_005637 [Tulasnella sp. 418]|nr:hypothetical protein FRC02_005637 [Tulasnella sp. 418]
MDTGPRISRKSSFHLRTTDNNHPRSSSVLSRSGSPSPTPSDSYAGTTSVVVGVCAMDIKARSKAMREILTRLVARGRGMIEVKVFGDKVILDEDVQNWPRCDILISFFSTDFPLEKAVSYVKLRQPVCINDLLTQELLWDRRCVLKILDYVGVPSPKRLEVTRDGGPKISEEVKKHVEANIGLKLEWPTQHSDFKVREDKEAIIVDGKVMEKPFVEKPVSGEDHNVYIYYRGGGGRRLFRKIGNQSSVYDEKLIEPRTDGSYIYEEFIDVENAEDIKVYTVGPTYTHAETRKSPVIDGLVRRNTEGKEIRFITRLTDEEMSWASKITEGFGQRVCGFDVLRPKGSEKSMVIDVNGWSFVKGNESYYDKVADILSDLCFKVSVSPNRRALVNEPPVPGLNGQAADKESTPGTWTLKANVTVFRHADRTPKQKLKYSFPVSEAWTQPFIKLLNGEKEEIILREKSQLKLISDAIQEAKKILEEFPPEGSTAMEDLAKLTQLHSTLQRKIDLPGTKAQLKPTYKRVRASVISGVGEGGKISTSPDRPVFPADAVPAADGSNLSATAAVMIKKPNGALEKRLEKFQLVFKWGGEFTHAARYQSRDLGENLKKDISILNRDVLNNVRIFTSSERRVTASAEIFAAALLDASAPCVNHNHSNTIHGVSPGPSTRSSRMSDTGSIRSENRTPSNVPTYKLIIRKDLLDDSNAAKDLMDDVKKRLKILLRSGESERRPELTWPKSMNAEPAVVVQEVIQLLHNFRATMRHNFETMDVDKIQERWCCGDEPFLFRERWEKLFEDFCEVKQEKFDPSRVSELYDALKFSALHHRTFLFAIFSEQGQKADRKLHELYARAKALFDLVAPQEYGIEPAEKEEIGVLTSLPLMRKIVEDLEGAKNSGQAGLTVYFTKVGFLDSHFFLQLT